MKNNAINRRALRTAAILLGIGLCGWLAYKYFSPHHYCVEYYKSQGIQSGMSQEGATGYAKGLCKKKNPFRN